MPDIIKCRVLVVDDEPEIGNFIAEAAALSGWDCVSINDASRFEDALGKEPDLVFLDLKLPDIDGVELLRVMAKFGSPAAVVLISGFDKRVLSTAEELAKALGLRVLGHLPKPIRLVDLDRFIANRMLADEGVKPARENGPRVSAAELARGIRAGEIELHYQPQIHIASGSVVGVEGLARWRRPDKGLVFPDAFISMAESSGLIDELGWAVLDRGLADMKSLSSLDVEATLSVNVSAMSLHDLSMPERIVALANRHGLAPARLVLEITESGLVRELAKALDILARFRLKSLQLSIDDFGTGYSMMEQLRRVPATELKIDRGFVQQASHNDSARVVVEKTIQIGQQLNMRVVAEGVETQDQFDLLQHLGCDIAQGYLFSRPLPAAELDAWAVQRTLQLNR